MPEMHFVVSSNVEAVGYDVERRELHVRFLGSGATYVYYEVEEFIFDELMRAPSKGSYLNREVKDRYRFARA